MANELVVPEDMEPREIIQEIVAYLREQAAGFDGCIAEGEALGEDMRWAKVKRMSVNVMADRVERGEWFPERRRDA